MAIEQTTELVVSSLGSGSNGNAFLVEWDGQRVLIDAGVPIRTLLACLQHRSLGPSDLTATLLSHEHTDHTRALAQLLGKVEMPVFATKGTHAGVLNVPNRDRYVVAALDTFSLGTLTVTPISVAHDAREPVGYFLETPVASLAIMTDLGEVSDINADFATRADHLIIESNYDEGMLRSGRYPAYLKKRIRSAGGHLSNDDCADFLRTIVRDRTDEIWLCHLSENNNRPEMAIDATSKSLRATGIVREVTALPRYDGTVITWRSSQKKLTIQQGTLPFQSDQR